MVPHGRALAFADRVALRLVSLDQPSSSSGSPPLAAVARLALWLGLVGFGGGYAVLAQLHKTIVERRRWMPEEEYIDAVSVAQSLPGATGANFFTLLGLRASGIGGAALATALFVLPSAAMMVAFGVFYDRLRNLSHVEAAFAAVNPAVVGIVASVAISLGRKLRRPWQLALALGAAVAVELGVGVLELVLLAVVVGFALPALRYAKGAPKVPPLIVVPLFLLLPKLALVFLRIGAGTFGGGMAMIPMLDHEVVERLGWLTQREFSDAVTLGQITPGPVAITTTFIGFRVAGWLGAGVATVSTFLPAFAATVIAGRSLQAFRGSRAVEGMLQTLAPVVVGIVAAAALSLGRASIVGWEDGGVAVFSLVAVVALEMPPLAALIAAAAIRAVLTL